MGLSYADLNKLHKDMDRANKDADCVMERIRKLTAIVRGGHYISCYSDGVDARYSVARFTSYRGPYDFKLTDPSFATRDEAYAHLNKLYPSA